MANDGSSNTSAPGELVARLGELLMALVAGKDMRVRQVIAHAVTRAHPQSRSGIQSAVACPARPGSQPAGGVTNGSRAGDRRTGAKRRRRTIQVWIRDRHRVRQGPEGAVGRYRPLHLGEEERTGMDAGMAAGGLSPLADHDRAELGARQLSQGRLSGSLLLLRAEEERDRLARRTRSGNPQDLREARHSLA